MKPQFRPFAARRAQIRTGRNRGVSLVEALVALAVMSFGMLALVGVQSTLRFNADVSRQRTEATRLTSDAAEFTRYFEAVASAPGQSAPAWNELAADSYAVTLPGATENAAFQITQAVRTLEDVLPADAATIERASALKQVTIAGSWTDRTGTPQSTNFDTLVARIDPVLSLRLHQPNPATPATQRNGRHVSIPVTAKDLGNGTSALKPFDQGTTAWVIDHATGEVRRACTGVTVSQAGIVSSDLSNCSTIAGRLISGQVQFDDGSNPEDPQGTPLPLYDPGSPYNIPPSPLPVPPLQALYFFAASSFDNPQNVADYTCIAEPLHSTPPVGVHHVGYVCIIELADPTRGWGGNLQVVPGHYTDQAANWSLPTPVAPASAPTHRVCRYTTVDGHVTNNSNHPQHYCRVRTDNTCDVPVIGNLSNQNFLVIPHGASCPDDNPSTALVNGNTWPHQPPTP